MHYARVVAIYQTLETTASRERAREALVALLRAAAPDQLPMLVYLTQGKLAPDFAGVQLGVAERLARRAVAIAVGRPEAEVAADLARSGDLGTTAAHLLAGARREPTLTVEEVYAGLMAIARAQGRGAIGRRIEGLAALLRRATPAEACFLVRTATSHLRLGVADMTLLDALAVAWGGSLAARPAIERAYNLRPDLGALAEQLARGGLAALEAVRPTLFSPIRPMLAQRLGRPEAVLAKLGGRCAAEDKYDGERLQVHKSGEEIRIFSRRLTPITAQYPDAVDLLRTHLRAETAIVEAEAVVRDAAGRFLPFQQLLRRKRTHRVAEAAADLPVSLMLFEVLFVDGEDLTRSGYPDRRQRLEQIVLSGPRIEPARRQLVASVPDLVACFDLAIQAGTEGLVCKSLAPDSVYRAGERGWLWIKLKRDAVAGLTDTLDLVVVGAFYGRGRRAGTYGSLLLAAYDPAADLFRTVTKCGTGFNDRELVALPARLAPYVIPHRHPRVDARLAADVWLVPAVVVEVTGAELTLSPSHTAAWGLEQAGRGLALRIPRFTGRWRDDKAPEQATTITELHEMYRQQRTYRGARTSPPV
jgi:DNA ligase 1